MSDVTDRLELLTASGRVNAEIAVPGSKSISNRALVCAALAKGESIVSNVAPGDDTSSMIVNLERVGVQTSVEGSKVRIKGVDGRPRSGGVLDAQLAGTTSRFLTCVAALCPQETTITGGAPLLRRPMGHLHETLTALGAVVEPLGVTGHLPVQIRRGGLKGGTVRMRGDVSSQFLTAMMLIGPYLEGGLDIQLSTSMVSRPYIAMTEVVMRSFGIQDVDVLDTRIRIPQGTYRGCSFAVEPDASSASYPLAAAAILGGRVLVPGLSRTSIQGDIRILDILRDMGCTVSEDAHGCEVTCTGSLEGLDIDMSDVSDLVPTVASVAVFARTPTRIRGIGFIRAKESDRIGDLVAGIERLGGSAQAQDDGLEIQPVEGLPTTKVTVSTHHDHRLAMAWSLIALRRPGVSIDDSSVVSKSWPEWWSARELLRRSTVH